MLSLLLAFAHATCPDISFAFTGQPACVELAFTGDATELVNRCDAPVLVDQSVVSSTEPLANVVGAGASTELRDLNTFTLGVDGRLYRVVAVVEEGCRTE